MRRFAAFLLLLAGCAAQPTPEEGKSEAFIPVATPVLPRAPHQVIQTSWNFEARDDECIAIARSGRTSLQVVVRRNAPIRLTVSLPARLPTTKPAPVPLRFSGPAGRWQVNARPIAGRRLMALLGSDDTALSRVLVLLSGGVLDVGLSEQAIPSLGLARSEAPGQAWFDCARRNMA